tara:strand:- start:213 stop:764 length:552 start_codon:yes stop_codon:yes gene_type:complete
MNILKEKLIGSHLLDICSGSGVISCEVLQKGAERVLAIEQDKKTAQICKQNLLTTASGLTHKAYVEVICAEAVRFLSKGRHQKAIKEKITNEGYGQFDLVYLDPPYESEIYSSILQSLVQGDWLREECVVICEHAAKQSINKPSEWIIKDERLYGKSQLLFISPPKSCFFDIGSKLQQKGPTQ